MSQRNGQQPKPLKLHIPPLCRNALVRIPIIWISPRFPTIQWSALKIILQMSPLFVSQCNEQHSKCLFKLCPLCLTIKLNLSIPFVQWNGLVRDFHFCGTHILCQKVRRFSWKPRSEHRTRLQAREPIGRDRNVHRRRASPTSTSNTLPMCTNEPRTTQGGR